MNRGAVLGEDSGKTAVFPSDADAWARMLAVVAARLQRLRDVLDRNNEAESGSRDLPFVERRKAMLGELERERSRIARDLHAGAGQPLAAIRLNLELLDEWAAGMPESAREAISRLRDLSDAALGQIRAVSHRLHPPEWQELTAEQAIWKLIDQSGVSTRFVTTVNISPLPVEPGHAAKVALYRCAQECISNVIRHSDAERVEIALSSIGERVELRIADDGKGMGDAATSSRSGIGLQAIREHLALVDGNLRIDTAGEGTTITVSLPLSED